MTPEQTAHLLFLAELTTEAQVVSSSVLAGDLEEARFRARWMLSVAEHARQPVLAATLRELIDRLGPPGSVQVRNGCGAVLLTLAGALTPP
jgi:hypothetical protein